MQCRVVSQILGQRIWTDRVLPDVGASPQRPADRAACRDPYDPPNAEKNRHPISVVNWARFSPVGERACSRPSSAFRQARVECRDWRREEVAVLAGVSVSWCTWLEPGREIQPSTDALRRIAGGLKLDRVESVHLFALSAREAPLAETGGKLSDNLNMLVRAIDPIPAHVHNTRLDILTLNDAIADLFVDYGSLQPHERNTLRLLFVYRPYRTLIRAWK